MMRGKIEEGRGRIGGESRTSAGGRRNRLVRCAIHAPAPTCPHRRHEREIWNIAPAIAGSLRLDVSRLDDRPPFLDLGFVEDGERFRRLLLTGRDFLTEISEPLAHG